MKKLTTIVSWLVILFLILAGCIAISRPQVTNVESVRWTGHSYIYCGSFSGHVVCQESDDPKRIGDTLTIP